ncbi:MAG: ArnT family glycosyltransferase [Halanaerobiaceae bacterium]
MTGKTNQTQIRNKFYLISLIILFLFFIFNAFYSTAVPISGDEAYHWEWSRHLDWGYYDHPPMVGWIIALARYVGSIIGGTELFWTRLPALLSVTGIMIIVFSLITQFTKSYKLGFYSIIIMIATPLFSLGANIINTDLPLLFFWGITLYFIYQIIFNDRENYWYLAGISLGFAFLSKFYSILLVPGLFVFLFLSRKDRHWLKRKELYIFLVTAGLIYLPNLIWNINHEWATFYFNLSSRHETQFGLKSFFSSVLGQMGVIGPVLFLFLISGLVSSGRRGIKGKDRKALFLFSFSLVVFLFFSLIGLFRSTGAHWPAMGYISLVPAFVYGFQDNLRNIKWKSGLWWLFHLGLVLSLIMTVIIHLLPVYAYLIPDNFNLLGNEVKVDHSDLGPIYGWEEIGDHLVSLQQETEEEVFFISPSYAFSSMVSFNTPGKPFVRLFGSSSVYGQNYEYWNNFEKLQGQDAIFTYKKPMDNYIDKLEKSFSRVEVLEPLKIYDPVGRQVRTIYFAYGESFQGE